MPNAILHMFDNIFLAKKKGPNWALIGRRNVEVAPVFLASSSKANAAAESSWQTNKESKEERHTKNTAK